MEEISAQELRELLDYCPETGLLIWKERPVHSWYSRSERGGARHFNRYRANNHAGHNTDQGYIRLLLNSSKIYAHTAAWLHYYGEMPRHQIDHINGDRSDNRILNLRDVPQSGNARNRALQSNNTSGHVGVCWLKSEKRWKATIRTQVGITKHLGRYSNLDDAVAARKAAEIDYGYHPNHGR